MAPNRRVGDEEPERRVLLQAVVLADSYNLKFRPITLEKPKVLLPVCSVPMIDYTLEWLEASGVHETFVFISAHSEKILHHLEAHWNLVEKDAGDRFTNRMNVIPIISTRCMSAGEALRIVYEESVINSDFILMTGDTVVSIDLQEALAAHKNRRKADKSSLMTMIMKKGSRSQRLRLGNPNLLLQIDPDTNQLLSYESDKSKGYISVDVSSCFTDRSQISLREDMVDCHIDICAPEVLGLFQDNFDYQHLRRDFVGGVLSEEELGNKIFIYELASGVEYAACIHNLRSYDAISRDIWNHWLWPVKIGQSESFSNGAHTSGIVTRGIQDVMKDAGVSAPWDVSLRKDCKIGPGTIIEGGALILGSFIGKDCKIGKNVKIHESHILDGVTVQDGAQIYGSLLSDDVHIERNAVVNEGCIVGCGVVIGEGHVVQSHTRVSMFQQIKDDSDSDDEYSGEVTNYLDKDPEGTKSLSESGNVPWDFTNVGQRGRGFTWEKRASEVQEWRQYSISSRPSMEVIVDRESDTEDDFGGAEQGASAERDLEDQDLDPEETFHNEVRETFLRCKKEQFDQTNALIELNALKIAENRTFADCARFILTTILGLCFPASKGISEEYRELYKVKSIDVNDKHERAAFMKHFRGLLEEWGDLLQRFLKNEDDQVELLLTLEEYCSNDGVFQAENGNMCASAFCSILQLLYDCDIITEDAILSWADEKKDADEDDKVFLTKAKPFLDWLEEAESETDEEDD